MLNIFTELENITEALDQRKIPYALCGALAVGVYAEPRATKDIDLLLLAEDVEHVKETLSPLDLDDIGKMEGGI